MGLPLLARDLLNVGRFRGPGKLRWTQTSPRAVGAGVGVGRSGGSSPIYRVAAQQHFVGLRRRFQALRQGMAGAIRLMGARGR